MAEDDASGPEVSEDQIGKDLHLEFASEILDSVQMDATDKIYEEQLVAKEIPFVASRALDQLMTVVDLAFVRPDNGESREEIESNWRLSLQRPPKSSSLDSWSRGVIPLKRKTKKRSDFGSTTNGSVGGSKLPSESGRSKTRSVASKLRSTAGNKRDDNKSGGRARGKLPDYIIKLSDENEDCETVNRQRSINKAQGDSEERARALKEMEDSKNAAEKARLQRLEEEAAEDARAEALAKELKGKDFILGSGGELIMVQPVNGDKLPSKQYEMNHTVVDDENGLPTLSSARLGAKNNQDSGGASTGRSASKPKKQDPANNEYYRSADSFQQSVLKNPALDVKNGVSIKQGALGKTGPEFAQDGRQMSRENFLMHQSLLESQFNPEGTDFSIAGSQDEVNRPGLQNGAGVKLPSISGKAALPALSTPSLAAEAPSPDDEFEPTSAGARAPRSNEHAAACDKDSEKIADYNLDMISNPNWGANPAPSDSFVPAVLPKAALTGEPLSPQGPGSPSPYRRVRVQVDTSDREKKHLPAPIVSPVTPQPNDIVSQSYVKDFGPVSAMGSIRVESDRAMRMLGLAETKAKN